MSTRQSFWSTPQGFGAIGLIGATSYFLFMEHREHLFEFLPYLILLACPLMHLLMHGGHGHHKHHDDSSQEAYQKGLEEGRRQRLENRQHEIGRDRFK